MLKVVTIPNPKLRERSKEIDREFLATPEIQKFIKDMIPTMYGDDGIGLAAPQVGKNIRICVIGKEAIHVNERPSKIDEKSTTKKDLVLVNPVIERLSKKTAWDTEGCLSVPKTYGKVKRYTEIRVTAMDEHGNPLTFIAKKFFARVIQHEVDHLDGILFIDKAKGIYEVE